MSRRLTRRTWAALAILLLAIPALMAVFVCVWDERKYYLTSLLLVGLMFVPFVLRFEGRRPQARELVLLATMTALAVKALGRLLEKRIYDWFFDRFSLVSLPVLTLFWIGVVRRTNEYGLTEPRVYLVVCGGLMTLCVLLFLSQRTGRYLWVCLAAWMSFAALAYVPFLEPERIAVQSQTQRAERVAERLGRLGGDGCC